MNGTRFELDPSAIPQSELIMKLLQMEIESGNRPPQLRPSNPQPQSPPETIGTPQPQGYDPNAGIMENLRNLREYQIPGANPEVPTVNDALVGALMAAAPGAGRVFGKTAGGGMEKPKAPGGRRKSSGRGKPGGLTEADKKEYKITVTDEVEPPNAGPNWYPKEKPVGTIRAFNDRIALREAIKKYGPSAQVAGEVAPKGTDLLTEAIMAEVKLKSGDNPPDMAWEGLKGNLEITPPLPPKRRK